MQEQTFLLMSCMINIGFPIKQLASTYLHQGSHSTIGEVCYWYHLAKAEIEDGGEAKNLLPDCHIVLVRCFHDQSGHPGYQAKLV